MRISDWSSDVCSSDLLDRLTAAIGRLERDSHVQIETLALFVRYELAIHAPLAENDHAGRAIAAKRFEAFIAQVGRQIAAGRRTIGPRSEEHTSELQSLMRNSYAVFCWKKQHKKRHVQEQHKTTKHQKQ